MARCETAAARAASSVPSPRVSPPRATVATVKGAVAECRPTDPMPRCPSTRRRHPLCIRTRARPVSPHLPGRPTRPLRALRRRPTPPRPGGYAPEAAPPAPTRRAPPDNAAPMVRVARDQTRCGAPRRQRSVVASAQVVRHAAGRRDRSSQDSSVLYAVVSLSILCRHVPQKACRAAVASGRGCVKSAGWC